MKGNGRKSQSLEIEKLLLYSQQQDASLSFGDFRPFNLKFQAEKQVFKKSFQSSRLSPLSPLGLWGRTIERLTGSAVVAVGVMDS